MENKPQWMDRYIDVLLEYNKAINVISRKITREEIEVLIGETLGLLPYIHRSTIVDAGSGNGIVGIPLAYSLPKRDVILIESTKKKSDFLRFAVKVLKMENVRVVQASIVEFIQHSKMENFSLVSRGFPSLVMLKEIVWKRKKAELAVITGRSKVEPIPPGMEFVRQSDYNIPSRNQLVILHMENVSRET